MVMKAVLRVTSEDIRYWLEWASLRMLAMEAHGTRPAAWHSYWPDFPADPWFAYNTSPARYRHETTAKADIPIMDLILSQLSLISDVRVRRIVAFRVVVFPSGRHMTSLTALAKSLHVSRQRIKQLEEKGLNELAGKIQPEVVYRIRQALTPQAA